MERPTYWVRRAVGAPEHRGDVDGRVWGGAERMPIAHFHARSSGHRPATEARLLYDETHLHALFTVSDHYVRAVHTEYDSDTYKDSCVELFTTPTGASGYFAFEVNCGGAFSLRYIEDPTRTPDRFARWRMVPADLASTIRVSHSMPALVDPERVGPVDWWVEVSWPFAVMEAVCGAGTPVSGSVWQGNTFKCGDETSHPHWASWAAIGERLNFHQPSYFGVLRFT
jgi:hypothetical protein